MRYCVCCDGLPLAIYREVAVHLAQVDGVKTELVPQQSQSFDYRLSQVDSIWLDYPGDIASAAHERVQQILAYYSDRYGTWKTLESPGTIDTINKA